MHLWVDLWADLWVDLWVNLWADQWVDRAEFAGIGRIDSRFIVTFGGDCESLRVFDYESSPLSGGQFNIADCLLPIACVERRLTKSFLHNKPIISPLQTH